MKVLTQGSTSGPEGVTVHLVKEKQEIAQTITTPGGEFEFPSVLSGNYKVQATHPK